VREPLISLFKILSDLSLYLSCLQRLWRGEIFWLFSSVWTWILQRLGWQTVAYQ